MSQAKTNKRRGFNFEREVVNYIKSKGHDVKRAYASNGESLGLESDVDVLIQCLDLSLQCKRRKKLPAYLDLNGSADASVFREDRGKTYIMLELDKFLELIG